MPYANQNYLGHAQLTSRTPPKEQRSSRLKSRLKSGFRTEFVSETTFLSAIY